MHRDLCFVDVGDVRHHVRHEIGEFVRLHVANAVRDVDDGRASSNRGLEDSAEVLPVGACGVHGRELDLGQKGPAEFDGGDRHIERLFARDPQLVVQMNVTGREDGVQSRRHGLHQRFGGRLDVGQLCVRKRGDLAVFHELADRFDRTEVAR